MEALRLARQAYLNSGYDLMKAKAYAFYYFQVLRKALSDNPQKAFLLAIAALEVFPIRRYFSKGMEAAGVIAARHPAYLLAKLRKPKAPENPQFLPLVCLPASRTSG